MRRSRYWTTEYRQRQIALFFRVWRDVVLDVFRELEEVSAFRHDRAELADVRPVRAAGLYAEAWLRLPGKLAREVHGEPDRYTLENRTMLGIVLGLAGAPDLGESLHPDAVRVRRARDATAWEAVAERSRVLGFENETDEVAFTRATAEQKVEDWLPVRRRNWLNPSDPGASAVGLHERMHAVVDAFLDDAYRVERIVPERRRSLLGRFPVFTLVPEPVPAPQADYERRCAVADLEWHQLFLTELERRGYTEQLDLVRPDVARKQSEAYGGYRSEPVPADALTLIEAAAQGGDPLAAAAWIVAGGAIGTGAATAVRLLTALGSGDTRAAGDDITLQPPAVQARVVAICVTALLAVANPDGPGDQGGTGEESQ